MPRPAASGTNSASFLNSLYRFVSVHGWQKRIFFYPGLQLVGTSDLLLIMFISARVNKTHIFMRRLHNVTFIPVV